MKIQDFMYFNYLVEVSSFTKTAEHFNVSQPTISIALKRLEDEFNNKLIVRDRSAKSFQLTATGEILYNTANEMIDLFERTHKHIKDIDSQTVEFGFLPTIGSYFLPTFMQTFSDYSESLELIEEESSDEMLALLEKKSVAIALLGSDKEHFDQKWIKQYPLSTQELKICVTKSHPLANEKKITPNQLDGESFITLNKGYTHERIFDKWLSDENICPKSIQYANKISTCTSFLQSSQLVGLLIDPFVKNYPDIVSIPLKNAPKFYVSLAINTDITPTSSQKQFNNTLLEKLNLTT